MSRPIKILLIEDSRTDANFVRVFLREAEVVFDVHHQETLAAGLRDLDGSFDAVLLDLNLPDSDGVKTIRMVHDNEPDIPIVVLTGTNDRVLAAAAIREGAQDYLPKEEFSTNSLARAIHFAIERHERRRAEQRLKEREDEFAAAREIQEKLIPKSAPAFAGLDIAGRLEPASATAGDFFDFIEFPDGALGVVIADVSSHGFGPSLIMAGARKALRIFKDHQPDLTQLISVTNRAILEDTDGDLFVTLFLAKIDSQCRSLHWVGAGHEAWILNVDGNFNKLHSTGLPLGLINREVPACKAPVALLPGQVVLLMTDGLWEAHPPDGELLGIDALLEIAQARRNESADDIAVALLAASRDHCDAVASHDDRTVVVVKVE